MFPIATSPTYTHGWRGHALYASGLRADLTTIPLHGVEPGHVVVATRSPNESRLIAGFRASVRDCLTGQARL